MGLQDWIGVIADQLGGVADEHVVYSRQDPAIEINLRPARLVPHRARSRCRRLEAGERGMGPYAGEIRDRCDALRIAAGWSDRTRRLLPAGGTCCQCRKCRQQKEMPLLNHAPSPAMVACAHAKCE